MSGTFYQPRHPFLHCRRGCALILLSLIGGCATKRDQIAQVLNSNAPPALAAKTSIDENYRVGFPDIVEISVSGTPHYSGRFAVNVEGRIEISDLDNPRVDGGTVGSIQRLLAQELDLPLEHVHCRVIEHQSRLIYVRGPVQGGDRAIPYQGPEYLADFIRRCGGLHPSANVKDIHVVRSNVPLGSRPQVFAVDLEAILLKGDPATNVLLQSFDEVYIGERPRAKLGRALPAWLRPVYGGVCGVAPGLCPHDWREQIRSPMP